MEWNIEERFLLIIQRLLSFLPAIHLPASNKYEFVFIFQIVIAILMAHTILYVRSMVVSAPVNLVLQVVNVISVYLVIITLLHLDVQVRTCCDPLKVSAPLRYLCRVTGANFGEGPGGLMPPF